MLRIKRHDLEVVLEYWRARCETMTGDDDIVSIYIGSPGDMEGRKECHVAFSDNGDVYIVEDNKNRVVIKLDCDGSDTVTGTSTLCFSDHTAFYEGDEVVSTPHRAHNMSRFTKGE